MKRFIYLTLLVSPFTMWNTLQAQTNGDSFDISFVDEYCLTCHDDIEYRGGVSFEFLNTEDMRVDAEIWEKMIKKLQAGQMPPPDTDRSNPPQGELDRFLASLVEVRDQVALEHPHPGRPLLHRFNRIEYRNAVRDLLALDVDVNDLLPPDDSSFGFDNVADVLGISPLLMEGYVNAAEKISALAMGDPAMPRSESVYRIPLNYNQEDRMPGLPYGTRGGLLVEHNFPLDGEYIISAKLWQTSVGFIRGLQDEHQLEFSLDGEPLLLAPVGGRSDYQANMVNAQNVIDALKYRLRVRVNVEAGPHDLAATFLKIAGGVGTDPASLVVPPQDPLYINGMPAIESLSVEGPFNPSAPQHTPSRDQIFSCYPNSLREEVPCARNILERLTTLAYRRPVTDDDIEPLMSLFAYARETGNFDQGIQLALQGILSSPNFIFRVEEEPEGDIGPVSDLSLASRLSFFLWSSIPDEELLSVASRGELSDPQVLESQIRRMLADEKARALAVNFGGQWLHLRNLDNFTPERDDFPDFDSNLRDAMRQETETFLDNIFRNDRSALELLAADYTYLNERLARHYGIEGVYGPDMRRVEINDPLRSGLLGQASILAVTSFPNRTSPVVRGKFVLENLIGTPPAPPPAAVPSLADQQSERPRTMREQMELHRADPVCASCHKLMDPIGLALEHFDATGAWRDDDFGNEIESSGTLADGTYIGGPEDLSSALLQRPEVFVGTLTEKLMIYALGRGLEPADMPSVRRIVRDAADQDYRFAAIINGIVNSPQFRMISSSTADTTL